jgi:hypothetical protein
VSVLRRTLTVEESLVGIAFLGVAVLACLMPTHNDTWWHLRSGQEMFRTRSLLFQDRFSFTAYGTFFWNHSWLSQLVFYPLYVIGGIPLLTAFCALLVATAWVLIWRLMRGDIVTKLLLFAVAISGSTSIWSVRPQVVSIVLLPVITKLAMEDRWRLIVPILCLWANLHAGFAMGLVVLGASVIAALVVDRDKLLTRTVGTGAAMAATLINPIGVTNWLELARSMARSQANQIQEWMPPSFGGEHLIFWLAGAAFVWQLIARWKHLQTPADRVLAVTALVALPLAGRTLRNIPSFMMLMAPAFSRLLAPAASSSKESRTQPHGSAVATSVFAAATIAAVIAVAAAWRDRWERLGWDPISPAAARAIASCRPPLYNSYEAGGPIIWFAPTQLVFVDSRQDPFPPPLVQEGTRVEATGDYRRLFDKYGFNCAVARPESPLERALHQNGWTIAFTDGQWTVLTRSH